MAIARALRALNHLVGRHHDALVARLAIVANIFVNWHGSLPFRIISNLIPFKSYSGRHKKQLPLKFQGQLESFKSAQQKLVAGYLLGNLRLGRTVSVGLGV